GIYDLETGNVEFLGKSPQQAQLLESSMPLPPSMLSGAPQRYPTVFDAMPGDLFALRSRQKGALLAAWSSAPASWAPSLSWPPGSALEGLLQGLAGVAQQASEDLGPGAQEAKLIAHAVKVNVFQMNFLLKFSELLRDLVRKGDLQIQGGIYHLASAGKVLQSMRADLNKMGQAPHTALVGCADSRAALETVFDAFPGDLFVLRNAANTCTHAEGSVLGSLEFCT
ncbi:NCE103, partial [Symbiodinium pilosum]